MYWKNDTKEGQPFCASSIWRDDYKVVEVEMCADVQDDRGFGVKLEKNSDTVQME